jgi:cytochrome c
MSLSTSRYRRLTAAMLVGALSVFGGAAAASSGATKDEAVAMVKKAVAHIKTEGPEKAYAAISSPSRPYVDRDLYIIVVVKERVELAATKPSFSQSYKFINR